MQGPQGPQGSQEPQEPPLQHEQQQEQQQQQEHEQERQAASLSSTTNPLMNTARRGSRGSRGGSRGASRHDGAPRPTADDDRRDREAVEAVKQGQLLLEFDPAGYAAAVGRARGADGDGGGEGGAAQDGQQDGQHVTPWLYRLSENESAVMRADVTDPEGSEHVAFHVDEIRLVRYGKQTRLLARHAGMGGVAPYHEWLAFHVVIDMHTGGRHVINLQATNDRAAFQWVLALQHLRKQQQQQQQQQPTALQPTALQPDIRWGSMLWKRAVLRVMERARRHGQSFHAAVKHAVEGVPLAHHHDV